MHDVLEVRVIELESSSEKLIIIFEIIAVSQFILASMYKNNNVRFTLMNSFLNVSVKKN